MESSARGSHDVFISYSNKDKRWADSVCAVLEQNRIRCWVAPRDIKPGMEWGSAIIDGLNSCQVMVLIFSEDANASPQVRREVERAINKGLVIIPLRIQDTKPDGALEYALSNTHWLDAFTPPVEEKLALLVRTVRGLLPQATPPQSTSGSGQRSLPKAERTQAVSGVPVGQRTTPQEVASSSTVPQQAATQVIGLLKGGRALRTWIGVGGGGFVILLMIGLAWRFWPCSAKEPDTRKTPDSPPPFPTERVWRVEPLAITWGEGKLNCVALTPDGQTVALGGESDTVELWDVCTGERRARIPGHPRQVYSLAFAPNGKTLAVGLYKQIWLWDVDASEDASKRRDILEGHTGNVTNIWFCPDGKTLVTASKNEAMVSGLTPGQAPATFKGGDWVLFPDGKTLARCSFALPGSALFLWDVATHQQRVRIDLGLTKLHGTLTAAGTADGRRVVVGQDQSVRVWNAVTREDLGEHGLHTAPVISVDLAADGKTVASGSEDTTAILWEVTTKQKRARLDGHTGPVRVRFSPCGKTLATGSAADRFVKLWDVATGKENKELSGHPAGFVDFQFSRNGHTLAVRCHDQVKLWNVAPFTATPE
jgi:hypothetical protein